MMFLNGYNKTGLKELTAAVENPKGSLYHYFGNKELVGLEVLKYHWESRYELYTNKLIKGKGSPKKRLDKLFSDLIQFYENERIVN